MKGGIPAPWVGLGAPELWLLAWWEGVREAPLVSFSSLSQVNTWEIRGGKIYFGSEIQRFQSMVSCYHWLWACNEAEHHGKKDGGEKPFPSWHPGSRAGGGEGGREVYNLYRNRDPLHGGAGGLLPPNLDSQSLTTLVLFKGTDTSLSFKYFSMFW